MFSKYNKCVFCKNKKLVKSNIQKIKVNFYIKAIIEDLEISRKKLNEIKTYKCTRCGNLQNKVWFSHEISEKIYSNIYGQHNKSWTNILNYIKNRKVPNHGNLFTLLKRGIKIKKYGEYNSPFMGLLINFFENETKFDDQNLKRYFLNIIKYGSSRQLAGLNKKIIKKNTLKAAQLFNGIKNLRKKFFKKKIINKVLINAKSNLHWGQNDNYKSVNSITCAKEFFHNLEVKNNFSKEIKFDLFGFFLSLDHTFDPKKIFEKALNNSDYVIVYCHSDTILNKQHLFSFTKNFLEYLNNRKIYSYDLTKKIEKKFNSAEMYFICSKKKNLINNFLVNAKIS